MIVVDTSVWISLIRNADDELNARMRSYISRGLILIGDIILLEILQGARSERHAQELMGKLSAFPCATMSSPSLAIKAAGNYRTLREEGMTIRKTTDLIIGTYCIENKYSLLHADRDFVPMVAHLGLKIA